MFLDEKDWDFLSGPKKHRHPELTEPIRRDWAQWGWPCASIFGNHEPWNRLRNFDPNWFGEYLTFTTAGEIAHKIPGLRVVGLSGIFHPEHTAFPPARHFDKRQGNRPLTWPEMVDAVSHGAGGISVRELAYHKQVEVDAVLRCQPHPHLLLTHDWPVYPEGLQDNFPDRPELKISCSLEPQYHFAGHHHRCHASETGNTHFRGLNIVAHNVYSHEINPGWAYLLEWDQGTLTDLGFWPR